MVEGEAQLSADQFGTFDVLFGPGLMWMIDGQSAVIHELNSGRIPMVAPRRTLNSPPNGARVSRFLPAPLVELDADTTGPDYLAIFCASAWGDEGPFWIVESPTPPSSKAST